MALPKHRRREGMEGLKRESPTGGKGALKRWDRSTENKLG